MFSFGGVILICRFLPTGRKKKANIFFINRTPPRLHRHILPWNVEWKLFHLDAARITTLSAKAMSYIPSPAERLLLLTSIGRGSLCDRRTPEGAENKHFPRQFATQQPDKTELFHLSKCTTLRSISACVLEGKPLKLSP